MKLKTFSVGIVAVLLATMLSVLQVRRAEACYGCCGNQCATILTLTCNTLTFSLPGTDDTNYEVYIYNASYDLIGDIPGFQSGDGPVSVSIAKSGAYYLELYVSNDNQTVGGNSYGIVIPPCVSNAVTWFTPSDARINGHPGDQIAVYCNRATATTPANIDVWGIVNGDGFSLTKVNVSDISHGSAFKDGKGGVVFLGGNGANFYAAWLDGAFGANAQGDFAKTFSCTF